MTKFVIFTIVINIIAMIAVAVACYRGHKAHQEEIKRGRRPW